VTEPYHIVRTAPNVLTVHFEGITADWEQWLLLSSDRHHDNINCNRKLEKKHLDQALERNALIFDFGDLFCAMQGKYDPRSSMDEIRPEDAGEDYLDRIVKHAAADYAPYVHHWVLLTQGNHETGIIKRHHHSLTSALKAQLNSDYGGAVHTGGFGGWVRFLFTINKTKRASVRLKYYHGSGGSDAQVTRGVIQTNRQAVYLPDADIVVNGHNHSSYVLPIARERLSERGAIHRDIVWFVRTPGYKDEYGDGSRGWAVERGQPPKPLGACWVRFFIIDSYRVGIEAIQAVE